MSKWDERFLSLAKLTSKWSKDPSTKVGAVIVRPDKTIASCGYNGFPRGVDDSPAYYDNREEKYARMIHAEINAILHSKESLHGYTLYLYAPVGGTCDRCAAQIIQAGIKRVVYWAFDRDPRWEDSFMRAEEMFDEAHVEVVPFD